MSRILGIKIAMVAAIVFLTIRPAEGALFTLTDGNSTAVIDTETQDGMSDWEVDGVDHMFQQWFWYRLGTNAEASIDTLDIVLEVASDSDIDGDDDSLAVRYRSTTAGSEFDLVVTYKLVGGGSGSGVSIIGETISIFNESAAPLEFTLFQYSDFDISGTAGDDFGWYPSPLFNTVRQADSSSVLGETVETFPADRHEISFFPDILDRLNDADADDLTNTPGAFPPDFVGPGDVTWAYQWSFTGVNAIAVDDDVLVGKVKNIRQLGDDEPSPLVPEPASLAVWGGLSVLGLVFGRRFAKKAA